MSKRAVPNEKGGKNAPPKNATPPPPTPPAVSGQSVEASLEDFIQQAHKTLQEPVDGWTLNTDEVELVEDADLAPERPAEIAVAKGGAAAAKQPVVEGHVKSAGDEAVPEPLPQQKVQAVGKKRARTLPMPTVAERAKAMIDEPPAAAAATPESAEASATALKTDELDEDGEKRDTAPVTLNDARALDEAPPAAVAASPSPSLPAAVAASPSPVVAGPARSLMANPLALFGIMLGAFILGALVVYFLVRSTTPTPVTPPPAPAPRVARPAPSPPPPAAAPTTPATSVAPAVQPAPTVMPIKPTVTPLAPPVEPSPVAAPLPAAKPAEKAKQVEKTKPAAPVQKQAEVKKPVETKKPAPAKKAAEPAKPAAASAPAKEKPAAKPSAKKDEWVDPFAQ